MNEQALQTNIKTCFECGEDIFHHYSCKNFPKRWARIDAKPQFRGWIEGRKMTEHQAKKDFAAMKMEDLSDVEIRLIKVTEEIYE